MANFNKLPHAALSSPKRFLQGERFVSAKTAFESVLSWHHGHVQAVIDAMRKLRFDQLASPHACPKRERVLAMLAARILAPERKLATTRWWAATTLPQLLALGDSDKDDLYAAPTCHHGLAVGASSAD